MRQFFLFVVFLIFCLISTTCKKKISSFPFNMEGIWYAPSATCGLILEIKKNNKGKLQTFKGKFCESGSIISEGKVKYKKNVIYIHKQKMTIIEKPITVNNESMFVPDENYSAIDNTKKQNIYAKMTIEMTDGWGSLTTYHFFKYIAY